MSYDCFPTIHYLPNDFILENYGSTISIVLCSNLEVVFLNKCESFY